jgi:hypothetical protein
LSNASGQITCQQHVSTLDGCPKDSRGHYTEAAFRSKLDEDYAFKWDQFPRDQEQLRRVWTEYSKPGGLCEQVDTWRAARIRKSQ